jgi:hypothetical protein
MRWTIRVVMCAVSLAFAIPAAAQGRCAPGDSILAPGDARMARFAPGGTDTSEVWMERDTARRPVGTFVESVTPVRHGGGAAFLVVQRMETARGVILDSITVRAGTFAPLRHAAVTPRGSHRIEFSGVEVRGTAADSAGTHPVSANLARPAFDYSLASFLLQGVPLCEGLTLRIPLYEHARGEVQAVARVVGAGTVQLRGRAYDVWNVDMDVGIGTISRQYVERSTGRLVGWSVELPGGRGTMKSAIR